MAYFRPCGVQIAAHCRSGVFRYSDFLEQRRCKPTGDDFLPEAARLSDASAASAFSDEYASPLSPQVGAPQLFVWLGIGLWGGVCPVRDYLARYTHDYRNYNL